MHYFLLICAFVFPSLILFSSEYSNLNAFISVCVFALFIASGMKIYLQKQEIKRLEELKDDYKDERNYMYELIEQKMKEDKK